MLPFSVSIRTGRPLHDQIVFAVSKAIVIGQLRPGDRFPSVRTLSQELESGAPAPLTVAAARATAPEAARVAAAAWPALGCTPDTTAASLGVNVLS